MARQAGVDPEFQRLHGMGEALYAGAAERYGAMKLRVYAPVGGHEELLPYLVRRLLENGANTSFVHALLDEKTPVATVVGYGSAEDRARSGDAGFDVHLVKPVDESALLRSLDEGRGTLH